MSLFAVVLSAFCLGAQGQTLTAGWYQQFPANSPSTRYIHALTYDAAHKNVVLFGGYGGGTYLNDTWLWDGTNWTQAAPATTPPARAAAAMVYDAAHGQVVMFGGLASVSSRLGDTWLWDGTNWTQANPVNSPSPRDGAVLVYDAARGQVLLFGGTNGSDLGDTWVWNGTNWIQQSPANSPSGRADYSMAYDAARSQVVLFGGSTNATYVNDTWVWNGTTWTMQNPVTSPPARYAQGMAYSSALGEVVMFGGYNGVFLNDTWVYDGTTWTQDALPVSPNGRYAPNAVTYDAAHAQSLLFGALGSSSFQDTWQFGLPGNFGSVNICPAGQTTPAPCSRTLAFTYNLAASTSFGPTQVVTQGAAGLDFTLATGNTCTGTVGPGTCTVSVTFAPGAPGLRMGAVQLVSTAGNVLVTTPISGVGQGPAAAIAPGTLVGLGTGLKAPYGVASDSTGNVFIADSGNARVLKVAPSGTSTSIGFGLINPTGVAVDGAGDVFIANQSAVVEVPAGCASAACQIFLNAGTGVQQQTAVAVNGAGDLYLSALAPAQVIKFPAGCTAPACTSVMWTPPPAPGPSQPTGIAVNAAGDLFIADGARAQVLKIPAGCTTSSCQAQVGTGWIKPTGVAVDAAGDVFVSDANRLSVTEVPVGCASAACQSGVIFGGSFFGVALDAQGDVIVPDIVNDLVFKLDRSQPSSLQFASTSVGSTSSDSPRLVTLQNIGNQALLAETPGLLFVPGPDFVSVPGPGTIAECSATGLLAPGAACNVSLSFKPQSAGNPLTGSATFHDNALNVITAAQVISLTGAGTNAASTIGGSVSGLLGTGLVLQNNLGNNLAIVGDGPFTFSTPLPTGSTYSVTVLSQAAGQACTVANGSGTVASANVTNVQVTCANPISYALALTEGGTGSGTVSDNLGQISCVNGAGTCLGTYPTGTSVTLTATASGTSVFVGWGGACSSSGAAASCVVTLTSASNVSATFVLPPASQSTLAPITAGVVYGQRGSFIGSAFNNGGPNASTLNAPAYSVVDANGNLYVSDGSNNRVLFYPYGSTTATRVYGQGGSFTSSSANNGVASAGSFNNPQGLALDSGGNLYVADEYNNRVLFFPAGSTTPTRVYGQGGSFTTGATNNGGISSDSLFNPLGIALDRGGNLYVADSGNSRVLFYPAGSTSATRVYGQGGSFTSNTPNNGGISADSLNQAAAVALDSSGDLYVADLYNNRVLFYPAGSTTATQVYGQGGSFTSGSPNNSAGPNARGLNNPLNLAVDSNGSLYVVDRSNNRVLFYTFGSTTAARVYGQGGSFTANAQNNGGVSANSLAQPRGVSVDKSGNVFIADYGNNRVLGYGSFGNVNACAAGQAGPAPCNNTITYSYAPATTTSIGATQVVTQGVTGLDFTLGGNSCTGTIPVGSTCNVNVNFKPLGPGLRAGAVQIFDNIGNPLASALARGIGQEPVLAFSPGTQTSVGSGLATPIGVAVDAAGNVFVGDYGNQRVVEIPANGGNQITIASGLNYPEGVVVDGAGNVYIADSVNNRVLKVPPGGGPQTTVGSGLNNPTGVAVDGAGNVFIADYRNNRVVEVPAGSGPQTTVGSGLNVPQAVAVDGLGNVFIADSGNNQVVKVTSSGVQTTLPASGLNDPIAVAVDAAGDVFIGNYNNNNVIEVTPSGVQTIVPASGLGGNVLGIAADGAGDLFLADFGNSRVVEVSRSQVPSLSFATTNVGSTSADSPKAVTVQNVGNQPLVGSLALNLGSSFTQNPTSTCSNAFPLVPGATCSESFSFAPQSATFFSGSAVFASNNLNVTVGAQSIALNGTGAVNGVPGTVAVPDVVGLAQSTAATPLSAVGLAVGTVTTASSSTVPAGTIIGQSPATGTQVSVGSAVNLLVSSGMPQPPSPNPLLLENNYFVTGDYVSAGVTLRGTGTGGVATGTITIPSYAQNAAQGVPDGADIVDAFLYWETLESSPSPSSARGTFNRYPIVGQQIGRDLPNFVDGQFTGTLRSYRAAVNALLPVGANGIRLAAGSYTISLPDSGGTGLPLTEGASLVLVYRVLSPNFPLKSVVIYDGLALPTASTVQVVQGFYDAVGGGSGTGKNTNLFASAGAWNTSTSTVTLGQADKFSATLNPGSAYAAVILSTPVNNSDNDGILDAWKTGPGAGDFHAGQPGYYDAKTASWVGLPGAKHGQKDLFVQLDYMCGALLANGACDPAQENLFPSPDADGNDPLAMVQQAFANSGVQLHLQIGNAVPETTCTDDLSTNPATLCQFPGQPGVVGWKNSLEFSKLFPRNFLACITGGDCTTRFPFGQKDSFHYVLFGHSLAIPAWNTRYGTLTSINVSGGVTTIGTVDRGNGINACPARITLSGVLGNPGLNGVYNTTSCADTKTITLATPGVTNWSYPNSTLPEPVIGLTSGKTSSISGYSDLGGADSAVTLGLWLTAPHQDMSKRANVLAGTLFHEIGHTLGLGHGGLYFDTPGSYVPTFEANCKPNYQSVMNYMFQLDLVGPNQSIAFSNQTLGTLNENSAAATTQLADLANNPAAFATSAWYVPYTAGLPVSPATRHCDGTPLNGDSAYRVDASIAPITPAWTNGQDLSFTGVLQSRERGFNDLANMDLRQVGATGGEFAALATALSFGSSVAPLNISAGGNVALGSGGTVALGNGGTVTLGSGGNVTLGSGGTITLGSGGNVTLGSGGNVTLGSGGTVTPGSSGTVTLGSGGNVTLGSGGNVTLGSGGTITLGSGGNVTLGSGGTIALGSGGTVTIPSTGGAYSIDAFGGTITLGSGGNVTLGSGGNVTLGSGGTIALGSGGNVTLGSGGNVTLGSGGTIALGSGGNVTLGSGGNVTLGSGGTIALGSGGTITLGSGGNVTLGSGGTVTLGSGGNVALGSGGNVTLGSGGQATLGAGGTVTLGSGGTVTLGSGGNVTLGSGGTVALGSGGNVTLGSGGNVTLGSGGTIALGSGGTITLGSGGTVTLGSGGTVTLGSGGVPIVVAAGGTVTLGSGGTVTLGSGGNVTLGSGGNVTLGSGGTITLGSGGTIALGSGGTIALGSGGTITLGSGGTITLGSGGNVTLGSGGVVSLGNGGSVVLGSGSETALASVPSTTPGSGGPVADELTYETANSFVRVPTLPTQTSTPAGVRINWKAPAFGVVSTYTIYRGSNGATPMVIGSVSGVNGFPPATGFTDTNPDLVSQTVVYTVTTTLVPDPGGAQRQSLPSAPAVLKKDQTIALGALPSSVILGDTLTVTATAMSSGIANGLQVAFSVVGACAVSSQSILNNISSTVLTFSGTGTCTLTASQPGATTYNSASSVTGTIQVLPLGSTTRSQALAFAPLPNLTYGNTFSLGASSSSGLPVSFTASGPCTAAGYVSGVGMCSITATSPGNGTYSAASVTQQFTIFPAVLKVTANNLNGVFGQPLPALTYSYSGFVNRDTAAVVNGAPGLSTVATNASSVGTYPITISTGTLAAANYSFLYVNGSFTVQQATQAALILNTSSPLIFGQSEMLSYSGGTTKGPVTYSVLSGPCAITGARLTAGSGSGACLVSATMAGTINYAAVTSTSATILLAQTGQTVAFTTNPPATAAYNSGFTVAATSTSGLAVTFTSSGACTNSGPTYMMINSTGTCSVIANQPGDANYSAAPQLTKTVTASGPLLTVSPSSINFGTVYLGSVTAKTITVTNTGTAPATVNDPFLSIVKGGNSNEFVAISLCPRTLAAGKSCTVLIGFIAGPFYTPQTAVLQIMSNAPGSPQPVVLSAFVINPVASFNPTSVNFGTLAHAGSSTVTVNLINPGATPLLLNGINVTGQDASTFMQSNSCGSSLAAGSSCTIAVRFTPPNIGTFRANLTVVDNAQTGGGTQTVALSGKGN